MLVYETELSCRDRLAARGFGERQAGEIASYLAQSTDMQAHHDQLDAACKRYSIEYRPTPVEKAQAVLEKSARANTLVWMLTDGTDWYRGTSVRHLVEMSNVAVFGSSAKAFSLCPDKFFAGAVLAAAGLPVAPAGLARDGKWVVPAPDHAPSGWFVKPNKLGAKIGIGPNAHCRDLRSALAISRRIFADYRDDTIVQAYVPGRNARASFLAVERADGLKGIETMIVDSQSDFQTMEDSLALYGKTGAAARKIGRSHEPELVTPGPAISNAVGKLAARLSNLLGLSDVFSLDLRIGSDGEINLLEFEVCPGLPCFDFRDYCKSRWHLELAEAMAAAAAVKFEAI